MGGLWISSSSSIASKTTSSHTPTHRNLLYQANFICSRCFTQNGPPRYMPIYLDLHWALIPISYSFVMAPCKTGTLSMYI